MCVCDGNCEQEVFSDPGRYTHTHTRINTETVLPANLSEIKEDLMQNNCLLNMIIIMIQSSQILVAII